TYPDNTKYYQTGVFLQDEWSLRDNVQLVNGLRYSRVTMDSPLEEPFGRYEETFQDVTGSVALSYRPVATVNLIGRWSRGFRAPNLNDAVVLKYSSSGVDAPSTDLDPEYSNNYELGVKVENGRAGGSLFLFYNQLSDLIDRVPGEYNGLTFFDEDGDGVKDPDEYDIYQRYNVDRARIYGFEFEGEIRLNPRWQLRANGFWTRGENQSVDEPMSRIPPLMGLLAVRYQPAKNMWAEIMSRGAGEQMRLSQRDIEDTRIGPLGTEGWVTLNLKYHLEFDRVSLNLMFENIFDEAYKEHGSGIYSPGRGVVLTLRYDG
ncbi:MAG: TonB-dependent receptor, partial [candidate division Zixibacteria bacterium]|nr:TonB-dependent receptor [candidate division Zixibacteria bacterium]